MNTKDIALSVMLAVIGCILASSDVIMSGLTGVYGMGFLIVPLTVGFIYTLTALVFKEKPVMVIFTITLAGLILLPTPIAGPPMYVLKTVIFFIVSIVDAAVILLTKNMNPDKRWAMLWSGIHWFVLSALGILKYIPIQGIWLTVNLALWMVPITTVMGIFSALIGYNLYKRVTHIYAI